MPVGQQLANICYLNGDGSPVDAFDAGSIGDWEYQTQGEAAAGALIRPLYVWTSEQGTAVVPTRTKSGSIAPTEEYITGLGSPLYQQFNTTPNDPDHIEVFRSRGGTGLPISATQVGNPPPTEDTPFMPRGFWGVQVHNLQMTSAIVAGRLARYNNTEVYNATYGTSFNYVFRNFWPINQPAKLVWQMRYEGVVGQTIPSGTFSVLMRYGNPDFGTEETFSVDFALPHNEWVKCEIVFNEDTGTGRAGAWNKECYLWALVLNGSANPSWFSGGNMNIRLANGRIALVV